MNNMQAQMNTVFDKLKRLEICLEKGFPVLPNYLVVVKVTEMMSLIDAVYQTLPQEMKEAKAILRRREEIQREAQQRAEKIINEAQAEVNKMLDESVLMQRVENEAKKYQEQVQMQCEEIKKRAMEDAENYRIQAADDAMRTKDDATAYAEDVLLKLEQILKASQEEVKNGQIYMEKLRGDSTGGYDPLKHNYPQNETGQDVFSDNFKID